MSSRRFYSLLPMLALVSVAMLSGCSRFQSGEAIDPAVGHWVGHWYVGDALEPSGALRAAVERIGETEKYLATFEAEFGGEAVYELRLDGERRADEVIFGGTVDLGETSGGKYDWKGVADGFEFNGTWSSLMTDGAFQGRFEMQKASSGVGVDIPSS